MDDMSLFKFEIHHYNPAHSHLVMLWVDDREYACLEAVPTALAQFIIQAHRALVEISKGDGCYGAQAFEYKNIAREALGLGRVGTSVSDVPKSDGS